MFPSSKLLIAVVFIYDNYALDKDAQTNVSINSNSFGIIL